MFPDAPERFRNTPPRVAEATDLVAVGRDCHDRDAFLSAPAAAAWKQLVAAASIDGVELLLVSAFRSHARQAEIVRRKRERGLEWDAILRVSAYPGFSEHHTGRAVDIGTPGACDLEETFENTLAFAWLARNASTFGFTLSYPRDNPHGIAYEPWHWCWSPNVAR
ncbi:hypothetical protein ASA1KI_12360 [Opitutales bacterium ASA1]|uniref:M15 family metallopeptidase n=1 Tax=Congregicoccus parvus TaxID=3081749 RepID=UPI002B283AFF|nr:hypothetical protein ASA1KI_12360 [Opitutales bacterium ASA1]